MNIEHLIMKIGYEEESHIIKTTCTYGDILTSLLTLFFY